MRPAKPVPSPLRPASLAAALAAGALALSAAARGGEDFKLPPCPEPAKPYAGIGYVVPYEDVLDHATVILVGKVTKAVTPKSEYVGGEKKDFPGVVTVQVEKVLRGEVKEPVATVLYGGGAALAGIESPKKSCAFLCIRNRDGALALAGDPPEGGGLVREGPELVAKLLEAAADPQKGYASADFAVKLSSGCRLARAWLAKPAAERSEPPAGLVEVLLEGLRPTELRGGNVNASARDALNLLFNCNLNSLAQYSVRHGGVRRTQLADDVAKIWERTVQAVRDRRVERARNPQDGPSAAELEVARLIKKLASDSYPEREAAQQAILKIGKPALAQVRAGAKSDDENVAAHCKVLLLIIDELPPLTVTPTGEISAFDLDRAEPLVPKEKKEDKPEGK